MQAVKYPRTPHLPWSPGATSDDKMLRDRDIQEHFYGTPVVVTAKMDGENTTMYRDGIHARSLVMEPHPSRNWVKSIHARVARDIPEGWRVCGENMYAQHSIEYNNLPGYFMVFSVWNGQNVCLDWNDTAEWAKLLNLPTVPVIYRGAFYRTTIEVMFDSFKLDTPGEHEGYVVRKHGCFHYNDFSKSVAKYVRANHVQTSCHWMRQKVIPNKLDSGAEI